MDYEFIGTSINGLDFCIKSDIVQQSVLVTGRFEEPLLVDRCQKYGMKLLPKSLAGLVPIKDQHTKMQVAAILIDEDPLIRLSWQMRANDLKKEIATFSSASEMLEKHHLFPKETPVFVDSDLGNNIKGEYLDKHIHEIGFQNIYLATGYPADKFERLPWLKGIVGKEPVLGQ